jgi:hypothetical protein
MTQLNTQHDAQQQKLIILYDWQRDCEIMRDYFDREKKRIEQRPDRTVMIVKKGIYLSLWVDDKASREIKIKW